MAFGDRLTVERTSASTFWQLGIISVKDRAVTCLAAPWKREEKEKKSSTPSLPVSAPGNGCEGLLREEVAWACAGRKGDTTVVKQGSVWTQV